MSSQQTSENAKAAIQTAMTQGLSPEAGQIMISNLDDTTLMGCIGASIDDLDSTEATIVTVLIDKSGSMEDHVSKVIDEYNAAVAALQASKGAESVLWSLSLFDHNQTIVHGHQKVKDIKPLTAAEYSPSGGTALYDAFLSSLTSLTVYGQQLTDNGVPNRRILFVLSDGENMSGKRKIHEVKAAVESTLRKEMYTFAFAGFGHLGAELEKVAINMGIPKECITNGKDQSALRRIFQQMSQSVSRISQGVSPGTGFF